MRGGMVTNGIPVTTTLLTMIASRVRIFREAFRATFSSAFFESSPNICAGLIFITKVVHKILFLERKEIINMILGIGDKSL